MKFKSWFESIVIPPGNLNIPRKDMPQIQASDVQEFLKFLETRDISYVKKNISAKDLKATQKEIDMDKVDNLKDENIDELRKPLLVSKDHHIMDGHHRWLALLGKGLDCPCYLIDAPMKRLLELGKEFPKSFKKHI